MNKNEKKKGIELEKKMKPKSTESSGEYLF